MNLFKRASIAILGAAAAAAFMIPAGVASASTTAAPCPQHAACIGRAAIAGYLYSNDGNSPTYALHAHTFNGQLSISSSGLQKWEATDAQTWLGHTVYQVQLAGTSGCATWHTVSGVIDDNTCQNDASHPGQLFFWESDGSGGYWLINELASNSNNADVYLTTRSNTNNSLVDGEFAGAGGRARWAFTS